jgi:hypothetical protein
MTRERQEIAKLRSLLCAWLAQTEHDYQTDARLELVLLTRKVLGPLRERRGLTSRAKAETV